MTILIASLSAQACSQPGNIDFIAKITNDFSRNSYFIVLNVRLSKVTATYLIDNDDLYFYFFKTRGYNEARYKKEIGKMLMVKTAISIAEADLPKFGFMRVMNVPRLNEEVKKGKEYIMNKYFRNNVIIDGVKVDERNVLIKSLFDWGIASRIDDESGYLVVNN